VTDVRAAHVERFRAEQGARRVHLLTAASPFVVTQARFIVVEGAEGGARLIACPDCTPRTALGLGAAEPIAPAVLDAFLRDLDDAVAAWAGDAVPAHLHDGVTITVERADADGYARVRLADPAPDSPHARLLAAWAQAFPAVRRAIK